MPAWLPVTPATRAVRRTLPITSRKKVTTQCSGIRRRRTTLVGSITARRTGSNSRIGARPKSARTARPPRRPVRVVTFGGRAASSAAAILLLDGFLAGDAVDRVRHDLEPGRVDRLAATRAVAVGALVHPRQGLVDLAQVAPARVGDRERH